VTISQWNVETKASPKVFQVSQQLNIYAHLNKIRGRDSSVGIATRLWAGQSGDQTLAGVRLSARVQTGPGAHPPSYKMGTGSFLGVKRPGRGVDHPPPSSAEVKKRVGLYLYSPYVASWPVIG
jgi:hypothetical protein